MGIRKFMNSFGMIFTAALSGALLISCLANYASLLPLVDTLSIGVPWLMGVNLILVIFWSLKKHWILLLPLAAILLALYNFGTLYEFRVPKYMKEIEGVRIMTFNTRNFSDPRYVTRLDRENRISSFVQNEAPNIVCFQEFSTGKRKIFDHYPFKHFTPSSKGKSSLAIISKFPILNSGFLEFPDSGNNCIFADVLYKSDTLRIYNVHLQSYYIRSRRFLYRNFGLDFAKRLLSVTKKHHQQAELVREHRETSPYPSVICGDFNATPFSHTYRILKGGMQDSFRKRGSGWGTTFYLSSRFPFRIDYILADDSIEILSHQNFDVRLSDHLPVMATLQPKGQ